MSKYLDKKYHESVIENSITETEKTQAIQNFLLLCILEKLEGDNSDDKIGVDSEILKATKRRK